MVAKILAGRGLKSGAVKGDLGNGRAGCIEDENGVIFRVVDVGQLEN